MQAMFKSELAKLAGVSSRTFRRYLATRRAILTAMGVSPFARKLPPYVVHYISEDYCIDIPPCIKWLLRLLSPENKPLLSVLQLMTSKDLTLSQVARIPQVYLVLTVTF